MASSGRLLCVCPQRPSRKKSAVAFKVHLNSPGEALRLTTLSFISIARSDSLVLGLETRTCFWGPPFSPGQLLGPMGGPCCLPCAVGSLTPPGETVLSTSSEVWKQASEQRCHRDRDSQSSHLETPRCPAAGSVPTALPRVRVRLL